MNRLSSRLPVALRAAAFALTAAALACTCSPFGLGLPRLGSDLEGAEATVEGILPLDEIAETALPEEVAPTEPPPTSAPTEPAATATPTILIPDGEASATGRFTDGQGDCMANPAGFTVPNLIIRVNGSLLEIEQPEMHLNTGSLDQSDGLFDVGTGKGPNSEGYMGIMAADYSATGEYRFTTAAGTCTFSFVLVPN